MAEMTLRLRIDPDTGKKDIIITLNSDDDALPHEHEQAHRALVEKLIESGTLKEGEVGNVIVEREEEEAVPELPVGTGPQAQPAENSNFKIRNPK